MTKGEKMNKENFFDDRVFQNLPSEKEDQELDTATYKISSYGADFTLEVLSQKIENKEISIPAFQRKFVWTPTQSSQLVESFLLGLPVPQIFLYKEEESQSLLVVDGQQRLKSVHFFFQEKFDDETAFFLRSVKSQWEGKRYSQLVEPDKRRLKNSVLRATIFQQTDPKDNTSIFEIFRRLNTGGVPLTQQEIRNCIVRGDINLFLETLNKAESWRTLFGKRRPDGRMRDLEMILRFLALYVSIETYKKPMKDFITDFMKLKKNINEKERQDFGVIFLSVMDFICKEIGPKAFKLKSGINIAIFDSISVALARIGVDKVKDFKVRYRSLMKNEAYLEAISKSTTDKERVESRFKIARETFSSK